MFDQFSDGYCPQCLLDGAHFPMELNSDDFWECPVCHLQAHTATLGMFAILRNRGSGKLRTGEAATKATDKVVGWVLTKAGKGVPETEFSSIKKDLDPETLEHFERLIDAFDARDERQRERDIPVAGPLVLDRFE